MGKAQFAEFLLSLVSGRQRAVEIVGDLLEQSTANSQSFWWMIVTTIAAFTWRWVLAIVLAAASSIFGVLHYHSHLQAYPEMLGISLRLSNFYFISGTCIWTVVVLNALRYEIKSKLSGVGLGVAGLLLLMAWLVPFRAASFIIVAVGIVYLAVCLSNRSLRGPFVSVAAAAVAYAGAFCLLMNLIIISSNSPTLIGIQFFGYWFLSFVVEATVFAYTRRISMLHLEI